MGKDIRQMAASRVEQEKKRLGLKQILHVNSRMSQRRISGFGGIATTGVAAVHLIKVGSVHAGHAWPSCKKYFLALLACLFHPSLPNDGFSGRYDTIELSPRFKYALNMTLDFDLGLGEG